MMKSDEALSFQEEVFNHVLFPQSLSDFCMCQCVCVSVCMSVCVCLFACACYVSIYECIIYSIYSICVQMLVFENMSV